MARTKYTVVGKTLRGGVDQYTIVEGGRTWVYTVSAKHAYMETKDSNTAEITPLEARWDVLAHAIVAVTSAGDNILFDLAFDTYMQLQKASK